VNGRLERARSAKDHVKIAECLQRMQGPILPLAGKYILHWFSELNGARGSGMDVNPISFPDIFAWSQLRNIRLSPWDLKMIQALDICWRNVRAEEQPAVPMTAGGEVDTEAASDRLMAALGF